VSATVEYAVSVLGVRDVIVCGHSDCGAMKGLSGDPAALAAVPTVANWLKHGAAARQVVDQSYPELTDGERVRALSLENIVSQLQHLRTHPSVAAAVAQGNITLHGWFVDIHEGVVLGLDGESGRFVPIREGEPFPVAQAAAPRQASDVPFLQAAE
jgi:carbonic anhydrase